MDRRPPEMPSVTRGNKHAAPSSVFGFFTTRIDPRYPELQIGLPFFIVLSPEGDFVWKTNNYRDVDGMRGAIERAKPDA